MIQEYSDVIIKIIVLIITGILIPMVNKYINTYVSEKQLNIIKGYIETGVRCANQIYTQEQWKEKKQYVLNYATEVVNGLGLVITSEQLDTIIEGIVNQVKTIDSVATNTNTNI